VTETVAITSTDVKSAAQIPQANTSDSVFSAQFPGQVLVTDPAALCGTMGTACPERTPRRWADVEYLLFFAKDAITEHPLLTVGTPASGGALGVRGTSIVFGAQGSHFGIVDGLRLNLGTWLNECETLGLESGTLFLERASTGLSAPEVAPLGPTVLARPYIDAVTGVGAAVPINAPGSLTGVAAVQTSTQLYGGDLYLTFNVQKGGQSRTDVLVGGRYLDLNENLEVSSLSSPTVTGGATFLGAPVAAGNGLAITDRVDTINRIYAGSIGARTQCRLGQLDLSLTGKVGLGWSHEAVFINGATTLLTAAGPVAAAPGGVLAARSNVGRYNNDEFTVIPEVNASVGLNLTKWLRIFAGYNFLYMTNVARAGTQFDNVVNAAQIPASPSFGTLTGPVRPYALRDTTDFFVHGVNLGVQLRY
jgi:Putative beta barrel porin-7 (BBP7)